MPCPICDEQSINCDCTETERLRLTDEERQAVEWCLEMAILHATDCDDEIATMRGLLERTK